MTLRYPPKPTTTPRHMTSEMLRRWLYDTGRVDASKSSDRPVVIYPHDVQAFLDFVAGECRAAVSRLVSMYGSVVLDDVSGLAGVTESGR